MNLMSTVESSTWRKFVPALCTSKFERVAIVATPTIAKTAAAYPFFQNISKISSYDLDLY